MINTNRFSSEGPADDTAKAILAGVHGFKFSAYIVDGEVCIGYELQGDIPAVDAEAVAIGKRIVRDVLGQLQENAKRRCVDE